MAHVRVRGNGRFTAMVVLADGSERSAGTYDDEGVAARVADEQEKHLRGGSGGLDPAVKATMTVREYGDLFLRNHRVAPSTKSGYKHTLKVHVYPYFGDIRIAELEREAVRSRITSMQEAGASVTTQRAFRAVMSAMMNMAMNDGYRNDNPVRGLSLDKRPRRSTKKITVMTTDQFGGMLKSFPTKGAQALARTIISTGCRPSEAFALNKDDVDFYAGTITFNKAVQTSKSEFGPDGDTMFIADTKTHDERKLRVDKRLLVLLGEWIDEQDMKSGDLLFPRTLVLPYERGHGTRRPHIELTDELLATLGTFFGPNGKEYRHGTMNGYVTGKCGCDYCKQGLADYRYNLESNKRTSRRTGRQGHPGQSKYPWLTRSSWRDMVQRACRDSGLSWVPTAYQLRHTHASWLIAAGEDPKTVMTRMGHASLDTTSIYVHQVDDGSSSADIMDDLGADWDF